MKIPIKIIGKIRKKNNLNLVIEGKIKKMDPYTWILLRGSHGFSKKTFMPRLSHLIAL